MSDTHGSAALLRERDRTGRPLREREGVIAVDIGGTMLKGAMFDRVGGVIAREAIPSFSVKNDAILGLLSLVGSLRDSAQACGVQARRVGLASPGLIDSASGTVRFAANLRWESQAVTRILSDRFGIPATIEHDARAAARAEAAAHSALASPVRDFAFIPIGTGVSAAIVANGAPVTGATGASGEFGHICVDPRGEQCACGQIGCVEAYASAGSLVARYRRLSGDASATAPTIIAAVPHDSIASTVWNDAITALARGICALVTLVDPAVVIIGGGLSGAGETLLAPLREAVSARLAWRAAPEIVQARVGADAGLIGSALLAWGDDRPHPDFVPAARHALSARIEHRQGSRT